MLLIDLYAFYVWPQRLVIVNPNTSSQVVSVSGEPTFGTTVRCSACVYCSKLRSDWVQMHLIGGTGGAHSGTAHAIQHAGWGWRPAWMGKALFDGSSRAGGCGG